VNELSVIVPVHNAQDFLQTSLATMRQNHREGIEFIVIDDASEDDTPRIIEAALPSMPYITFIRNEENLGVAKSRNVAMEQVDSHYLSYFDADDWYAPGHLPRLIEAIKTIGTDMVRIDHVRSVEFRRTLQVAPEEHRNLPLASREGLGLPGSLSIVDYPFLWAGIYDLTKIDRSLFGFHEHLRTAADRPWFWRMHLHTKDYAVVDGLAGYFYRKDPNWRALTQGGNPNTLHFIDAYHLIWDQAFAADDDGYIRKAAYGGLRITDFHIKSRDRLSPELQELLYRKAAVFLSRLDQERFDQAVRFFARPSRIVLSKLYEAGVAARDRFGATA